MIQIVYWSGTGNTEKMAQYIEEGIKKSDKEVEVKQVSSVTVRDIIDGEILLLGCPAMGSEELDHDEMEPFIASLEGEIKGKKIALFGSYGWGNGEWMEEWASRMEAYGAELIAEPLIINEFTDGQDEANCISFGESISKL